MGIDRDVADRRPGRSARSICFNKHFLAATPLIIQVSFIITDKLVAVCFNKHFPAATPLIIQVSFIITDKLVAVCFNKHFPAATPHTI